MAAMWDLATMERFLAERLAEDWGKARDDELTAGLHESRATRDIDAKREILAAYSGFRREFEAQRDALGHVGPTVSEATRQLEWIVRNFAAVYCDHPEYAGAGPL